MPTPVCKIPINDEPFYFHIMKKKVNFALELQDSGFIPSIIHQ
ncbi:hypothetical protein HMPREF0649_02497 [Segatella buccae D17]|nr:hypothetical protein HMPREF0649_02497 [Segatella buccae D17]